MTESSIKQAIERARINSIVHNICYILSNGTELLTAVDYGFVGRMKEQGYWVAAIFQNGLQIDL